MKDLRNLKNKKVTASLIETAGNYIMNVVRFEFINSFEKNFDHEEKDGLREKIEAGKHWADPTPQVAITFGDKDGNGVITDRLNGCGYLNQNDSEVTDAMLAAKDVLVIGDYVCKQNKDGQFERIESPEKTEKAMNMIYSFINKLGITNEDVSIDDALKTARDDGYVIGVVIEDDEYNGNAQLKITKFHKVDLEDVEEEEPALKQASFENAE